MTNALCYRSFVFSILLFLDAYIEVYVLWFDLYKVSQLLDAFRILVMVCDCRQVAFTVMVKSFEATFFTLRMVF